jgi:hypothetical protein
MQQANEGGTQGNQAEQHHQKWIMDGNPALAANKTAQTIEFFGPKRHVLFWSNISKS